MELAKLLFAHYDQLWLQLSLLVLLLFFCDCCRCCWTWIMFAFIPYLTKQQLVITDALFVYTFFFVVCNNSHKSKNRFNFKNILFMEYYKMICRTSSVTVEISKLQLFTFFRKKKRIQVLIAIYTIFSMCQFHFIMFVLNESFSMANGKFAKKKKRKNIHTRIKKYVQFSRIVLWILWIDFSFFFVIENCINLN